MCGTCYTCTRLKKLYLDCSERQLTTSAPSWFSESPRGGNDRVSRVCPHSARNHGDVHVCWFVCFNFSSTLKKMNVVQSEKLAVGLKAAENGSAFNTWKSNLSLIRVYSYSERSQRVLQAQDLQTSTPSPHQPFSKWPVLFGALGARVHPSMHWVRDGVHPDLVGSAAQGKRTWSACESAGGF